MFSVEMIGSVMILSSGMVEDDYTKWKAGRKGIANHEMN